MFQAHAFLRIYLSIFDASIVRIDTLYCGDCVVIQGLSKGKSLTMIFSIIMSGLHEC